MVTSGPRRGALGVLAAVAAVVTFGAIMTGPGLTAVADRAAATAIAGLGPDGRGLRATTRAAADPAAQSAGAVAATADLGVPLATLLTFPVASEAGDVVLAHTADWAARVRLTGTPPTTRPDGVVEVAAPAAAGWEVGRELTVGQARIAVVVTATWDPLDPADPVWFGDPGLAAGTMTDQRGAVGPLWTAGPGEVAAVVDLPQQRWTWVPPAASAAEAGRVARDLAAVPDLLAEAGVLVRGQVVDGTGPQNLGALATGLHVARAHAAVPAAVVAVAGLIAVVAVARALGALARRETELLAARGATRGWLLRRDAPAAAVAATAGAALAVVAAGILGTWAPVTGLVVAGAVTVGAQASPRRLALDRGRGRGPLVAWTVVVIATGVATAQLVRIGPVTAGSAEPLAAPAPALLLALAGVAAALLLRRARAAAPLAARSPGLGPLLTVRHLGFPVPAAAALALAAGAAVLARAPDDAVATRPFAVAATVAAGVAALCAAAVLGAAALGGRPDAADRAVLDRLGATATADRARRAAQVTGGLVAAAVGAGIGLALLPLVGAS